ncbi:uncharacterized protein RMCFA_2957 [Mycolicibacterium fortuitum subsp. acetamidolyticum]|uniref:Uncharacterized protein n=1 Tax=Mycolicibacterium fortuitum subsp. acetamidolyticum TaxID=144550 RepID=A0A117IEK5_MYCFO|nr:uncharacterized protein RMCFA_2957 [Mycolicibacterium fortuitum subsp. acetamidolyticum]
MMRSPEPLINHTVPSASTRPNWCGSLVGATATTGATRLGRGTGRGGPGRGVGFGVGPEVGFGVAPPGSLVVISAPRTPRGCPRIYRATRRLMLSLCPLLKQVGLCHAHGLRLNALTNWAEQRSRGAFRHALTALCAQRGGVRALVW